MLSEEDVETFVDVMMGKLASMAYLREDLKTPDGKLNRDEIRQVVVDTDLLSSGKVPLEQWLDPPLKQRPTRR